MAKLKWDKVNLENLIKRRDSEYFDENISFIDKSDFYNPPRRTSSKPASPAKAKGLFSNIGQFTQCPYCKVRVKFSRLTRHLNRTHGAHQTNHPSPKLAASPKKSERKSKSSTVLYEKCETILNLESIQISKLADELRVQPTVIINEAGRRGIKVKNLFDRIPHAVARRIREYLRWASSRKKAR